MSALAPTVPAMTGGVHPWRRLRMLTHIELHWHDGGPMGITNFAAGTISLRRGMTWAQRRCTVMHECLHAERGPTLNGDLAAREEERIRRETARLMLPDIKVIGDAIAWAYDENECADELGVDVPVLRYRLKHLHPAERAWLRRRLEEVF